MRARCRLAQVLALAVLWPVSHLAAEESVPRPNVVVIVTDDQGYADVGFQGSERIPTPHIDALAQAGVRFSNGYVSHPFCSPSRAGLLTGRYQQRFGHENNPAYLPDDENLGLPVSELTLANLLQKAGYVTGLVGKWHLGAAAPFYPGRRGFDEFYGFLGGGHDYFEVAPAGEPVEEYTAPIERNGRPVALDGYLTDALTEEAIAFVRRHRQRPFFLLLTYNAPHTPFQAPDAIRDRFSHIEDSDCRTYAAMIHAVDAGVGKLRATLEELDLDRQTLIFFLSDNGGQTLYECADNAPLRGGKGNIFEGGIRVPFVASWPGRLPAGTVYEHPVSALDIFPTAIAVADVEQPAGLAVDGVDLLPHLTGVDGSPPHDILFWRYGGGAGWAVRQGPWKLIKQKRQRLLFDLRADVGETENLAARRPGLVRKLAAAYNVWNDEMVAPRWPNPRKNPSPPSQDPHPTPFTLAP